jgi:alkylation response protein AidB-like acyl-CoA dehydrogenase
VAGTNEGDADREAFRHEIRALIATRLGRRSTSSGSLQVLGAGIDDLEAGRRYLAVLAEVGLSTPGWPEEYGGRGASGWRLAVIDEELRRFDAADLYPFGVGTGLVGPMLLAHGSPAQRQRWLPSIGNGRHIWCQLFSEPGAGSDLAGLSTRAERAGGRWRIQGQKVWTSRGHYADWGVLLARTDTSVPKHAGITAFAVAMNAPGTDVRPMRQMNGDSHFSEVFLDGVMIDDDQRIGDVGEGWRIALTVLAHERAGIGAGGAARGGGGMRHAQVLEHMRAAGAGSDPRSRQRAADVLASLRMQTWTARRARDTARAAGRPGPEGSGAKVRASISTRKAADLAIDLAGAEGMLAGGEWQTLFLTAPSMSIRGGTDEIQRNIIGDRVLGLPAEPRVDKDIPFEQTRRS